MRGSAFGQAMASAMTLRSGAHPGGLSLGPCSGALGSARGGGAGGVAAFARRTRQSSLRCFVGARRALVAGSDSCAIRVGSSFAQSITHRANSMLACVAHDIVSHAQILSVTAM